MQAKKNTYLLAIIVYVNVINIIFYLLRLSDVAILRGLIVYDYLLIIAFVAMRVPAVLIWIFFACIFTFDLLAQIGFLFLFNLPELVKNLEFSFLYELSWTHYFYIALILLFLLLNYWAIKVISQPRLPASKRELLFLLVLFFSITYALDFFNGGSVIKKPDQKIINATKFNIGESLLRNVGRATLDFIVKADRPEKIESSVTFRTFAQDSTSNQLLILLESWGLPQSESNWFKLRERLESKIAEANWVADFGTTPFKGGTAAAELRELLSSKGDYHYLLNKDSAALVESIFSIKAKQNYYTIAAHSFSQYMFGRTMWWRNIGVDSLLFVETVIQSGRISPEQLNYTTPFTSLNDEDALRFLCEMTQPNRKNFGYLLTENTHLPFYANKPQTDDERFVYYKEALSEEANDQLARIQEILFFFIDQIDKNQWPKVLIVGDHMPPFVKEKDRGFYSNGLVPYVLLSQKGAELKGTSEKKQ